VAAFSVSEVWREGGAGLFVDFGSEIVVEDPGLEDVGEFVTFSLESLDASFVENIRVKRLVMEGFSGGICLDGWSACGGGIKPLPLSFSVLETALTLPAVDCETGDPMTDGVCDEGGEGSCFTTVLEGAISAISRV